MWGCKGCQLWWWNNRVVVFVPEAPHLYCLTTTATTTTTATEKYILKDSDKFHFKFLLPYVSFNNVFEESLSFVFLSLKQILTTPIVKFVLQKTLDEISYQLK